MHTRLRRKTPWSKFSQPMQMQHVPNRIYLAAYMLAASMTLNRSMSFSEAGCLTRSVVMTVAAQPHVALTGS